MSRNLRHRGPDHTGLHSEACALLGNTRLAIIDPISGNQPIYNSNRNFVIVFNGEIYNYRTLRDILKQKGHIFTTKSDTEVLLRAFEEYGPECVMRLDGMFSFAIWNVREKSLFLARDRLGIKPLYFTETDKQFAFASEPKALLPLMDGPPRPNWNAVNRFFTLGYFPLGDCAFEGLHKFPAGSYGWLRDGRLQITSYWKPVFGDGEQIPIHEAARKTAKVAEDVIAGELESDAPVGVFLSGGLDSSLVAVYAQRNSRVRVPAFSLAFEEDTHDESRQARAIADHLGLDHRVLRLTQEMLYESLFKVADCLDEPFGDSTVVPLFALSEWARREVKVALTGWGGDELFGGYPTLRAHRFARLYRRMPKFLSKRLIPYLVEKLPVSDRYMSLEFKAKRFVKAMDLQAEEQHLIWMGYFDGDQKAALFQDGEMARDSKGTDASLLNAISSLPEENLVDRIMHLDAITFLEGNGLYQADKMTMAASLEARVPLLNNRMIDMVAPLPWNVKMHKGVSKAVLRHMLRPYLPQRILNLPKKGFGPPSSAWVNGVFADLFDRVFSREKVESAGIFRHLEIQRLLDEHRSRRADHGRKLWLLLSFQLWYDTFILKEKLVRGHPDCLRINK